MKRTRGVESDHGRHLRLSGLGLLFLGSAFAVPFTAQAHESFMDCLDNQNGTVTCQGGYVDGSPPTDKDRILIKDDKSKTLIEGQFDQDGSFTFDKPDGNFTMIFAGGEIGHVKRIKSIDLIK